MTRIAKLRQIVSANRNLHVKAAAAQLNVSEMTIRRDIRDHPNDFDYIGGHIFALESANYDLGRAVDLHKSAKQAACANALALIKAGDTIFIDCGTTLIHLVDLLPDDAPLTLVCYAMNIADRALRKPNIKLIVMGGEYHSKTASFALLKNDQSYESLAINTAFLSAAGLDEKLGATCSSFHEVTQKCAAMQRAQKSILVIDSSKINNSGGSVFAQISDFDQISTDAGIE